MEDGDNPLKTAASSVLSNEQFVDLVREHQSGLRSFIRSLGVDPMWVDDLAQEALVIAYERRGDYETGLSFRNWVWGIARHCVLNERRKFARRSRILNENVTDILLATSGDSPEAEGSSDEDKLRAAALKACLEAIPQRSRDLLRLRYEEEMKSTELAEEFNMNPPALRKALERIRHSIRDCMEARLSPVANR
ncbi:MAG: sigma-70 family RNA polymerase sigma factor [Verrucomicrobia bacterium]|nr:sigma-70 family RNA polymerase sigma factor [Verrucomicrobiota bacterium]